MDSVVNNLINSWDSVLSETEKKRNSFFNLSNKSSDRHSTADSADQISLAPSVSGQSQAAAQAAAVQAPAPVPVGTVAEPVLGSSSSIFNSSALTDKLVERIISMALPASSESQFTQGVITERLEMQKTRASLSVPIMSRNFILMNSRLSLPFELIDEVIRISSWRNPSYTLAVLVAATNLILNPVLAVVSPMLYVLFGIMCPAYFKHHPAEKSAVLANNPVPSRGLPMVEVATPKPVPELSREFALNLTDLQNHMMLYVYVFDFFNWIVLEFCYFKDEALSAFVFLLIVVSVVVTALLAPFVAAYLPVFKICQAVLTVAIWALALALHPVSRHQILTYFYSEDTRLKILTLTNRVEEFIHKQLEFVEEQEIREVEIYELQYLDPDTKNWSFICYSTDIYTTNSTTRQLSLPIDGTQSLQNVKAPVDWAFIPNIQSAVHQNNSWKLDLNPRKWVVENGVVDYIDIDEDEKWCYDRKLGNEAPAHAHVRRRRWCRDVIRAFQVDEILALSQRQEQQQQAAAAQAQAQAQAQANHDSKYREKKFNVNENGFYKIGNDLMNNNDDTKSKRNSRFILDTQYNNHMRKMSGTKK